MPSIWRKSVASQWKLIASGTSQKSPLLGLLRRKCREEVLTGLSQRVPENLPIRKAFVGYCLEGCWSLGKCSKPHSPHRHWSQRRAESGTGTVRTAAPRTCYVSARNLRAKHGHTAYGVQFLYSLANEDVLMLPLMLWPYLTNACLCEVCVLLPQYTSPQHTS